QLSLKAVAPAVIRTHYSRRWELPFGVLAKCRAAMAAGVIEPAQHTGLVAHEKNRLVAQLECLIGARGGNLDGTKCVDPVLAPDTCQLTLMVRIVEIKRC